MTCIAVIPARFGASRFPGKPLAQDTGKYLVQHVYEQVDSCPLIDRVVVATDDRRILDAVNGFGGACVMTRPDHQSGTDRIAEAAEQLDLDPGDLVLNVQGDEPEVSIDALRAVIECFQALSEGHGKHGIHVGRPLRGGRAGTGQRVSGRPELCQGRRQSGRFCSLFLSRTHSVPEGEWREDRQCRSRG